MFCFPNGIKFREFKSMAHVVTEAKALVSAYTANKLIADSSKSTIKERVHWVRHKEMKLRREPGTGHWWGDKWGPHPWRQCPARGKTCSKCGINDHFAMCAWQMANQPNDGEAQTLLPFATTGPPAKHTVTGAAVNNGKMCITCNLVKRTHRPHGVCRLLSRAMLLS